MPRLNVLLRKRYQGLTSSNVSVNLQLPEHMITMCHVQEYADVTPLCNGKAP